MRPTSPALAQSFLKRSLNELSRFTKQAIKLEGLGTAQIDYALVSFDTQQTAADIRVMGDADIGGFTKSILDFHPATESHPRPFARWHGSISTDLPRNKPDVLRTGYAGIRTPNPARTLFSKGLWDVDPYAYLALRIKSDGRKYFVNLQSETIEYTDIHQHRLFAKKPGQWETVHIKWAEFVRTNHGQIVEPQGELLREQIRTLGFSLTDRMPGPFELCIEKAWATNFISDYPGEGASQVQVEGRMEGEVKA